MTSKLQTIPARIDPPPELLSNSSGNVIVYRLLSLLMVTVAALVSGCSMCSTPYDCHYSAYGGSHPRGDRVYGRVGSAFNDASAVVAAPAMMDGEIIQDEMMLGEIIDGAVIDDGYLSSEAMQGEVIQGDIMQGDNFQTDTFQDGGVIDGTTTDPFNPSEVIDLPSTRDQVPPAYNPAMDTATPPQAEISDADLLEPPNTLNGAGGIDAMQLLPNSSPTPIPIPEIPNVQPHPAGSAVMPDVGGLMNGLPVPMGEATIEVLPAVIGY